MGLAEPRKRLKISHDPNNLAWSQSTESYGQKLLSSQGWKPGQGLGARNAKHFNSSAVPKLAVSYKDDTLGLGATLKSQDPIHTRTGLDAFQGLLWRLNGKSDVELENEANKNENRKLAMWAQARWGGVTFVPGGTLVQGDGYKKPEEEAPEIVESPKVPENQSDMAGSDDKAQRKAEKKSRKEEKRRKRDAGLDNKASSTESTASNPKAEMIKGAGSLERKGFNGEKAASKEKKKKKRRRPALLAGDESNVTTPGEEADSIPGPSTVYALPNPAIVNRTTPALPRIGRHVIRGRNIEAKKMAFCDVKMLDQIFMVKS